MTGSGLNEERLELLRHVFRERIPFNRVLGLEIGRVDDERVALTFEMKPEHVGNFVRESLHGGVISATLDTAGGLAAAVEILKTLTDASDEVFLASFARLGTIDLRIDYLRPGLGQRFTATAWILRAGSRVAVTRMELHNEDDELIAVGTGAYSVS